MSLILSKAIIACKSYQSAIGCGSCENGDIGERTAGSDMARESKDSEAPANRNTVRGVSH